MDRKNNKESGVLVIEAIVSLSIFMFALLSVLVVANIYTVQAKMQLAINSTAREISKYSYIVSMTGIQAFENENHEKGEYANEKTSNAIDAVGEFTSSVTKLFSDKDQYLSGDGLSNLKGNIGNIQNAGQVGMAAYNDIAEDPQSYFKSLTSYFLDKGMNAAQSGIAKAIIRPLVEQHLTSYRGGDADTFLKKMGVVNGTAGIHYDGTRYYESGNPELLIVVSYEVRIPKFLPIDLTYRIEQVAHTNIWTISGEDEIYDPSKNQGNKQEAQKSQWETGAYKETEKQFYDNLENEEYSRVDGASIRVEYNPDTRDFKSIAFHNPLVGADGKSISMENLDKEVIKNFLQEQIAGFSFLNNDNVNVTGPVYNGNYNIMMSESTLVIVVPEDEGLKEIYDSYLSEMVLPDSLTVKIETGFGTAASKQETKPPSQEANTE